jgi:hypothetical protein
MITADNADWLADFTRRLVEDRLAACGHNIARIRSIYRWEGAVQDEAEAREDGTLSSRALRTILLVRMRFLACAFKFRSWQLFWETEGSRGVTFGSRVPLWVVISVFLRA